MAGRPPPSGWLAATLGRSYRTDCLVFIACAWRDIRPAAVLAAGRRASPLARSPDPVHLLFDASGAGTSGPGAGTEPVPVGGPIPHAQVLVLDEDPDEVPAGTVGEIHIGGRGAELIPRSRYLSRLAGSAERSTLPGERQPARRLLPAGQA